MINVLSERLKQLRIQHNLSQSDVAKLINVKPSTISGYETGERTPSMEILLSLSYLYKCSTDYLLGKIDEPPKIQLDTTGLTNAQIHALQQLINTMKE